MAATKQDKQLLKEMLRHPASIVYRDDKILVLLPQTMESYTHYTNGAIQIPDTRFLSPKEAIEGAHVVRTYRNEVFVLKTATDPYDRSTKFQFCVSTPRPSNSNVMNAKDAIAEYIDKYPSLYKAFGELAKKHAYLPLIEFQSDDDITRALKKDVHNVVFIKNLTHKRKMRIVEQYPDTIKYVEQSIELCTHVIRTAGGDQLKNVSEGLRTQKLCHLAVQSNPHAIKYVPQNLQTVAICMEAVKRDGTALAQIRNPSLEVCIAAVNKSPNAWQYIKDDKLVKKIRKLRGLKKYR